MLIIYRTPFGSFETWEAAAVACERADMDPCTCIETLRINRSEASWETASYGLPIKLSRPVTVY